MPDQKQIQNLVEQLSIPAAKMLLDQLQKKVAKKPTQNNYVEFPRLSSRMYDGMVRPCTSKVEIMQHFAEAIMQDCDKKTTPTIKAQVVEALATIAELAGTPEAKKKVLAEAAKFVLIYDREVILYKLTNYVVPMH